MAHMLLTGNDIRDLRMSMKMTQAEFGKMLGVTDAAVTYWECEKRRPRYPMMERLSRLKDKNGNGKHKK